MARTATSCRTNRQLAGPVLVSYFPVALGDRIGELASLAAPGRVLIFVSTMKFEFAAYKRIVETGG